MDTINSQVLNNPDLDDGEEVITAQDVVDSILNNQVSDYDINDLMSLEDQAECFREIVGVWAARGSGDTWFDIDMSCKIARIDMISMIDAYLLNAAVAKGYPS